MWRRIWALGLVATGVAITTSLACRQLVGITDSPPEDLVTGICGLPYGTSTCASCVNDHCCNESAACAADPVCSAYEGCLGRCSGDPVCRSQCTIDHPVGVSTDISALSACLASRCESACGLECGGVADLVSEPDAATACQLCLTSSACSNAEACGSSESCDAFLRCALPFSTADTALVCYGLTDAGYTSDAEGVVASGTEFKSSCATPCAIGNYWACVGHVSWASPKAPTSTIGYSVKDYITSNPVAGALVSVCSPTDSVNCSQPLVQGTTDPSGRVSLTFPNKTDPAGHGLDGFVRVTSPNLVTTDEYWGFPLVEAQWTMYAEVTTPTELQQLFTTVNVTPDATRGTLTVVVYDCNFSTAPGVRITLSPADKLTHGFSTTGTPTTTTDQAGIVIFDNVPAGATQITATPLALDKPSSQLTVNVQPGITTAVEVWPTPMP